MKLKLSASPLTQPGRGGLAVMLIFLSLSLPVRSFAQFSPLVEVTPEQNKLIKLAGAAATKIPYVGPFIGPIAGLIFGEPKQPGYEEMRLEWQGYTNEQIQETRKVALLQRLDAYKVVVENINRFDSMLLTDKDYSRKHPNANLKEDKIKGWEALINMLNVDIMGYFKSQSNEPAAPLLTIFAAVCQLQVDAYDQLILLNKYTNPEERDKQLMFRRVRARQLNVLLEDEIQKTAQERSSQIVLALGERKLDENYMRSGLYYQAQWVTDRGVQCSPKYVGHELYNSNKPEKKVLTKNTRGVVALVTGINVNTANRLVAYDLQKKKREVIEKLIHDCRLFFLLRPTTVLKVELLDPGVNENMLWEMFTLLVPFPALDPPNMHNEMARSVDSGFIINWGIVYTRNNQYIINYSLEGFTSAQTGYVEMETVYAKEAKAFWTGPKGSRIARGENSMNIYPARKYASADKLWVQDDYFFDPWNWRMR